jgi:hypothetical protein
VGGEDEAPGGGVNPVISALKTIAAAVAALQERGDPKATAVMAAFQALLKAFGAGGGAGAEEPPAEGPEGAPVEEEPKPGANPQIM